MTSFWCFSINGFRAWFAEVDVFFCMKPFYSTNHVLSVQGSATASLHLPYSSCSSNQRASTNSVAALPRCVVCGARQNCSLSPDESAYQQIHGFLNARGRLPHT